MKLKPVLRRLLLFPLWPRLFLLELALLRKIGLVPRRTKGLWPPQTILLINPTTNLGDTLMMLPTVDALHRALPQAAIDLVAAPPMASALRSVPAIRNVLALDAGASSIPVLNVYIRIFKMLRFARRELTPSYDLVLLPRWGTDPFLSAYLATMSAAPRRCGHDPEEEADAEQPLPEITSLLTTVSHGGHGMAEGVREQLVLTACGLVQNFNPEQEERRPVQSVLDMAGNVSSPALLTRLGISPDRPFLLLAPGASHPARRWPTDRFAALAVALHHHTGTPIYTVGGPSEHHLGQQIEQASNGLVKNLTGTTTIPEAIALTQRAALLITNDSGPAHAGGSLGTPTLVLSVCPVTSTHEHANSPRRVRPVGPLVHVLQPSASAQGCAERCLAPEAHCILGLTIEQVFEQARAML